MSRVWTPEARQQQREAIRRWKPWEQSTGPKSVAGKKVVSRNAYSGGLWLRLRILSVRITRLIKEGKAAGTWPPVR